MDIWSVLCPNINTSRPAKLGKSHSVSSEPKIGATATARRPTAASRRLSYSIAAKLARSYPNVNQDLGVSTTDFFRDYSLEDVAMQNNCTVISNKVGPVVIKNLKEEYQMRMNDRNLTGRLNEQSAEHELVLNRFFLLKDQFVGVDRHDTLDEHGVPNLRVLNGSPSIYSIGQPAMNGLKNFTTNLLKKHKLIYYINVRAVPTLFLRRSGDFIPFSAYSAGQRSQAKMYETERDLHDAEREIQLQALRIASSNSGMFYYYNVLDSSPDEPHMYTTTKIEDLVTSRQMYAKIQSENPNFQYKRLALPSPETPTMEWIDSLVDVVKQIKSLDDKNAAVVFQGLTGEGPATLAAIMAHLLTCPSSIIAESNNENYELVREIETELPWREYLIQNMLNSSQLEGEKLRKEVNTAIATSCTSEALRAISNEALGFKTPVAFLGTNATRTKPEACHSRRMLRNAGRSDSANNITLRDVSELSLQTKSSTGEHRGHHHIRYEVCDEERLLKMLFFSTELYYHLLVFRSYALQQAASSFQRPFSQWLVHIPNLVFDLAQASAVPEKIEGAAKFRLREHAESSCDITMDPTFHRVVGTPILGIGQTTQKRFEKIISKLCGPHARKRYKKVHFINVREESTFYSCKNSPGENEVHSMNGERRERDDNTETGSQWELRSDAIPCMHGASAQMIEEVEKQFKVMADKFPEALEFNFEGSSYEEPTEKALKTTKDVMNDMKKKETIKEICDDVLYTRIPMSRCRIPRFKCFDKLIEVIRDSAEETRDTAFVFFCHNGKKRSTNMMVASCLILLHMEKFELDVAGSIVTELWAPDVEFTRGEFKVVLELMQILPDCHLRKREVDAALDHCHESMSTMHYHLRENLNPSYKKARRAKDIEEFLALKHRAYLGLELYMFLILFNCYLHEQKADLWKSLSFDKWMSEHATRLGVIELLNNLGFMSFGEDFPMNMLKSRWMDTNTLVRNVQRDATNLIGYGRREINNNNSETWSEASSPCH